MLVDEARLSSSVDHPNVIRTIDVVDEDDEVLLVMDYVAGESLYRLMADAVSREEQVPVPVVVRIVCDVLRGLQAAHDATDENGAPLNIIHRDVSPQNVLVGIDGTSRLFDFGVAKARGRLQSTVDGSLKGKLGYMAPEQLQGRPAPQSDIFAASTAMWEALTGRRLFDADNEGATIFRLLHGALEPPSSIRPELPPALDQAVMRGLSRALDERFAKASDMADALAGAAETATRDLVSRWVQDHARERLEARAKQVRAVENAPLSVSAETSASADPDPPEGPTTGALRRTMTPVSVNPQRPIPNVVWLLLPLVVVAGIALLWANASPPAPAVPATANGSVFRPPDSPATATGSNRVPAPPSSVADAASEEALDAALDAPVRPHQLPGSTTPPRPPRDAAPKSSAPPTVSPSTSVTPPSTRPGCETPSYIDENGITRYKVECL